MLRLLIDENIDHRILRGLPRRVPQLDFLLVTQIGLAGAKDIVDLELSVLVQSQSDMHNCIQRLPL